MFGGRTGASAPTALRNEEVRRGGALLPTVVPTGSRPLSWPPIGALPRNRLASSATGGASAISPPAGDREGRPYGGLQAVRCKPRWRGEGTPPYGGNVGADAPVRLVRRGKSLSAAMKTNIPRRLGRRGMLVYHFFMTQTVTAPLGYIVIRDRFPFMVVFREI